MKKTFPLEKIKELIEKNYKISEIAEYFNTSRVTMGKFLKENNLKTNISKQREYINSIDEEKVCEKYKQGLTIKDLEKIYKVSDSVIKRYLRNGNIKTRTNSESHQKYELDYDYFNKIDTMNKAYLLGFICADGWVTDRHEIGIAVQTDDKEVLDFFKNELKTNKPITIINNNKAVELRLQNEILFKDLIKYGIVPRKSLIIDIGEVIKRAELNKNQIKAFLLGYFDGDGGFTITKPTEKYPTKQFASNITGTYETCLYYKKYFNNVGFFTKRHQDEKNNYTYCIGGKNMVKNAFKNLYDIKDQLSFFYQRKYNKFILM